MATDNIQITVHFSSSLLDISSTKLIQNRGGLELIFAKRRTLDISMPRVTQGHETNVMDLIRRLISYIEDPRRESVFVERCPGSYLSDQVKDKPVDVDADGNGNGNGIGNCNRAGKDGEQREEVLNVRPGILVLINDADWELEGEGSYILHDRDEILFVSTLHGG